MPAALKVPTVVPDWLAIAAPNSSINKRDVLVLLNCSKSHLHRMVSSGRFPEPDWHAPDANGGARRIHFKTEPLNESAGRDKNPLPGGHIA